MQKALQSKIASTTKYLIIPGDLVGVYRKRTARREGHFTVTKVSKNTKLVTYGTFVPSVTDLVFLEPSDMSSVLPIATKSNDHGLKYDVENF